MSHVDERYAVWSPVRHRARVTRQCKVCRETVAVGVEYVRLASLHDGLWSHSVHCARCWAIFEAVCRRERDDALAWQMSPNPVSPLLDCGETWRDTFGEDEPDDVAALAFLLPHEVPCSI